MIKRKLFENFIPAAVILSLVHVFINEYAAFARWNVVTVHALLCAGIILDLIFSAEFIIKGITAAGRKEFLVYMKYKNGWIDFISSFPVLILFSFPSFYLLLLNHVQQDASLQFPLVILNVVAVIRMPQVLRSLRVLKLYNIFTFRKSAMAMHHASVAGSMAVFTAAIIIMIWSGISGFSVADSFKKRSSDYSRKLVELESAATLNNFDFREMCENILISDHLIMRIDYNDGKKFEKLSESEFRKYYYPGTYIKITGKLCTLTISVKDIMSENAVLNILLLLIILALGSIFILLYSWHFSYAVSDIAGALNAGFRKRDYNLMIKIKDEYKEEELFRLAQFYNNVYLPAKMRKRDVVKEGMGTPLTMDEVKGFNNKSE